MINFRSVPLWVYEPSTQLTFSTDTTSNATQIHKMWPSEFTCSFSALIFRCYSTGDLQVCSAQVAKSRHNRSPWRKCPRTGTLVTQPVLRGGLLGDLGGTTSMYSKKVAGFKGIVAFPCLTFRCNDDDLKASDVVMSRICAADDSGGDAVALKATKNQWLTSRMNKLQAWTDKMQIPVIWKPNKEVIHWLLHSELQLHFAQTYFRIPFPSI